MGEPIVVYYRAGAHYVVYQGQEFPIAATFFNAPASVTECVGAQGNVYCTAWTIAGTILFAIDDVPGGPIDVLPGSPMMAFLNNVELTLVPSKGSWAIMKRKDGQIDIWKPGNPSVAIAPQIPGQSFERQVVSGISGGYQPNPAEEYVVFTDKDSAGEWYLKGWSISQGAVVTEVEVGTDEPALYDIYGYAYYKDGAETFWRWNPEVIEPGDPDEGEGNQEPGTHRPEALLLNAAFHGCSSLDDLKAGELLTLIRGSGCDTSDDFKLFAVTMWHNLFVTDGAIYQPFYVGDLAARTMGLGVTRDRLVYLDDSLSLVEVYANSYELLPRHALRSPWDNNDWDPVPLTPWNVGSWGYGEILYGNGGEFQDWDLLLSEKQTYRISVIGPNRCFAWHDNTSATLYEDGVPRIMASKNFSGDPSIPEDCAAFDFSPTETKHYILRVYRDGGSYGGGPSLPYELIVDVL